MLKHIELTGWWQIQFDEEDQGRALGWAQTPPEGCLAINVPACWNEVFPERFHYDGIAWYFKDLYIEPGQLAERTSLCFEGANYFCEAFVNGQPVGTHEGGFTPFSFPVTHALKEDAVNRLAIRVDSRLGERTLPPSGVDWFNYGGIYRPVSLESTRAAYIDGYTLKTKLDGTVALSVRLANAGTGGMYQLRVEIRDALGRVAARDEATLTLGVDEQREIRPSLAIPAPTLWKLRDAYLYTLRLQLVDERGQVCDRAAQRFGVREFGMDGHKLLLNGEEIKLVGCAKHEDYPLTGRTVTREQLVSDYDLLRQMNANFVRLSHYPHNRREHEVLDELGMLAISEIPMVFLREAQMTDPEILEKSKRMLAETVRAERNTTSILFWSLFIECETDLESTRGFVQAMVDFARELDDTRLVVMASNRPLTDVSYDLFDVVGVNYWDGWYNGETVGEGIKFLGKMAEKYPTKPLLITSHGWEGLYGERSRAAQTPWSEDLQADYLAKIADVFMSYKNIVGEIVWTFADFHVSNWRDVSSLDRPLAYLGRPALVNHKGMVDAYRRPKSAYSAVREKFSEWQELVHPLEQNAGQNMDVRVYSNRRLMGEAAAFRFIDRANELLASQETIRVIFASASSQVEFLEALARNRAFVDWTRIQAFHLDEFVGIGPDAAPGFAHWIKAHLIDGLPFRRFEAIQGTAPDLAAECARYGALLAEDEIDIACVGLGENGHLAFNDPPVADFNDAAMVKVVEMDEACREQQFRDGVFPDVASVPRQALTVTIPAIVRARSILCVAPGPHKAVAVWKTLNADVSTACPATILRCHPDVTVYLDSQSAALAFPKG